MAQSRLVSNAVRYDAQASAASIAAERIAAASAMAAAGDDVASSEAAIRGGSAKTLQDLDNEIAALPAALSFTAQVKTAAYSETATSGEVIAWCNLSGGFTVALPAAAGNAAKLTYKNLRSDGPITIAAAGHDTIDGNAAIIVSAQYAAVTLVSDGASAWGII